MARLFVHLLFLFSFWDTILLSLFMLKKLINFIEWLTHLFVTFHHVGKIQSYSFRPWGRPLETLDVVIEFKDLGVHVVNYKTSIHLIANMSDVEDKKWMRQSSCFAGGDRGCSCHSKHRWRCKELGNWQGHECCLWELSCGQSLRYTLMQCLRLK